LLCHILTKQALLLHTQIFMSENSYKIGISPTQFEALSSFYQENGYDDSRFDGINLESFSDCFANDLDTLELSCYYKNLTGDGQCDLMNIRDMAYSDLFLYAAKQSGKIDVIDTDSDLAEFKSAYQKYFSYRPKDSGFWNNP